MFIPCHPFHLNKKIMFVFTTKFKIQPESKEPDITHAQTNKKKRGWLLTPVLYLARTRDLSQVSEM